MRRLLEFLIAYGTPLSFVALHIVAALLLVNTNKRHNQRFEAGLLTVTGAAEALSARVAGYFNLGEENARLQAENIRLQNQLATQLNQVNALRHRVPYRRGFTIVPDSLLPYYRYRFEPGRAIGNSTDLTYNYFTLNIGRRHGLRPSMGVISPDGVAGLVVAVSENYAVAMSVLNRDFRLSARVRTRATFGTLRWDGGDPTQALLENIPLHHAIAVGDTVVTSAYSSIFPEGITVGRVASVRPDADGGFHRVEVNLATDFRRLDYLYAIDFLGQAEQDSLVRSLPQPR